MGTTKINTDRVVWLGLLSIALLAYAFWSQTLHNGDTANHRSLSARLKTTDLVDDEDPVVWAWDIVTEAAENPQPLHPALQELGHLIENNDRVGLLFQSMFQEKGDRSKIQNYQHMLQIFNRVISRAPPYYGKGQQIGLPMAALLREYMGTPSGFAAFLDPDVNAAFREVLDAWGVFLRSPESAATLDDPSKGWFSKSSLAALSASANVNGTTYDFHDIFDCNPSAPYYGFRSWDDFFTRQFRDGMRPIAAESDQNVIAAACEAAPTQIARDLKARDTFWMKGQTYSLTQMLGNDYAEEFIGGTLYQGLLSAFNYHRWHAPVSGTVFKTYTIQGTYYSMPGAIDDSTGRLVNYPAYNSAMSTRSVILINADNPAIGLMAFIAVGMVEVSSCEITVKEGDHVKKGEELGMFHYGGSTHCLIFKKGVEVSGFPETQDNVAVRSQLAVVTGMLFNDLMGIR